MSQPHTTQRSIQRSTKRSVKLGAVGLTLGLLSGQLASEYPVQAQSQIQSITAADDGTGTLVEQNGATVTIEQGSLSTDKQNLFHSFETFSIEPGQSANFISEPSVQNILSRVNGGMPSIIEGLLQVSGEGQPNLYFMNPAGVLFGADAQVNLPGDLTVTTADGIGFSQGWFGAFSNNNYNNLIGTPNGEFAFLKPQGGSVVNAAELSVAEGNAIALLGNKVINTGTLSASGGAITLAAIPGENIVRISQGNNLLSLDLIALNSTSLESIDSLSEPTISPLDLPSLLTFSQQQHATGLTVNADGSVSLTSTNSPLPAEGNFAITSGTLTVDSNQSQGGQIAVLGDRIGLLNAQLSASGPFGGGNIRLGGDYQGQGSLLTANRTLVNAQTTLTADALSNGDGGRVIIWSDDATAYFGHTSVRGGQTTGNGGFVEVSGKVNLAFQGTVDANAPQGNAGTLLLDPEIIEIQSGEFGPQDSELTDGTILAEETNAGPTYFISETTLESLSGGIDLILEASDRITLRNLSDDTLSLNPGTGSIRFEITGNVTGSSGIIDFEDTGDSIETNGRSLTILGSKLSLGNLSSAANGAALNGGDITLVTTDLANTGNSTISTGEINTAGSEFGGDIDITAAADITIDGQIQTGNSINGGNVTIDSIGNITTEDIQTAAAETDGTIVIDSQTGDIDVGSLLAGSLNNLDLQALNGTITIDGNLISNGPDPSAPIINDPNNNFDNGDLIHHPEDFLDSDFDFFDDHGDFLEDGESLNDSNLLSFEDDFELQGDGPAFSRDLDFEEGDFGEGDFGEASEFAERDERFPRREGLRDLEDIEEGEDVEDLQEIEDTEGYIEESFDSVGDFQDFQRVELDEVFADEVLIELDSASSQDYASYLGSDLLTNLPTAELSLGKVRSLLSEIEAKSGNRSAVIYINTSQTATTSNKSDQATDSPELVVVTAQGKPVKVALSSVNPGLLFQTIEKFRADIISSARRGGDYYLASAQQLYQWLIAPIEAELGTVDTLVFSMDEGLRTLPIAALHDGEQFLVEKYSLGMVPALSLIDSQYEPLDNAEILAMGVSDFEQLSPLPAVPLEIELINDLWPGSAFLNEDFTRQTLVDQRRQSPYRLIHLATHAEFKSGSPDNSYIQLWDEQLKLSELHRLGWQYPAVDLLVLSACSTAVGSPEAEMGFAGLAVAAGVRSAMASLWSVSDVGTLALMSEFYEQLQAQSTKSEALRTAQLALLNGNIRTADGQLLGNAARGGVALPSQLGSVGETDFSHPYYWSGFTMIGSPW